jgi:hypothetical protein
MHWDIEDSKEKYKGVLQYCEPKMARTTRTWPSHKTQDYDDLIKNIRYFYRTTKGSYSISKVLSFIQKWQSCKISTMDDFVYYHRKYAPCYDCPSVSN